MLCEHVKDVGRSLVTDPERTKDPVEYVQALLDMRDKYETIIVQVRPMQHMGPAGGVTSWVRSRESLKAYECW
jgi:hypothetical protein